MYARMTHNIRTVDAERVSWLLDVMKRGYTGAIFALGGKLINGADSHFLLQ
jgi:hypothetical protein